jgi:prepilin peptidase CpaA
MQSVVLIAAISLCAVIAYSDVRSRRISNPLSLAIAILGLVRIVLAYDTVAAAQTVAAASITFAATFLLFWRGAIGGGDAKLIAATVLLIGSHGLPGFSS